MVLDNVNRLQKFQNLANKYNNEINSTSNITAQKKIAQLRDQELEALKQIDHITEKDLERAEKKLDIIKAQIALEEAQKNKSQLRLRRDSQGNYRYQYVADEEEVQKAQENLANAYNELYNFDKERYKNNLNDAYVA
jgi:ribosomal protein S13